MSTIVIISLVRLLIITILSFLFPFHDAFVHNINHFHVVDNKIQCHQQQHLRHNQLIIQQHMIPPSSPFIDSFDYISTTYSDALQNYPLFTKSSTGFILCGVADVLAQSRALMMLAKDNRHPPMMITTTTTTTATTVTTVTINNTNNGNTNHKKFLTTIQYIFNTIDYKRIVRFAIKGFFGAIVWSSWYDISDTILPIETISSILSSSLLIEEGSRYYNIILNIIKTTSLILIEQFIACPIIFSTFEIPAATILNNAPLKRIPYEINDKLYDMLVANFKVWTWANMIIYNVPVQYRVGLSNVIDIFWQSIVADFAANCGNDTGSNKVRGVGVGVGVDIQEECRIEEQALLPVTTENNSTITMKTCSYHE
jgi:hypothetical protein